MKKLLHVGCGQSDISKLPAGFQDGNWQEVRFDIDPTVKPDIVGSLQDMSAVASGSMDALYSSHNIEHVYFHEVVGVLKEFKRVLKPDGFCVITCPDVKAIAKDIIEGGVDKTVHMTTDGPVTAIDVLYGHSGSIALGHEYMAHKTGFDLHALADRLSKAGFPRYQGRQNYRGPNLWFVAFKMPRNDEEVTRIFKEYTAKAGPYQGIS